MIGRLTGRVVAEEPDTSAAPAAEQTTVGVDVQGVGYELTVPLGTLGRAPRTDAGAVTLFVHTHAREDVLARYGFASEADRVAFRTHIGVSNVGPKTAIAVLSILPAEELARTVGAKDVRKLTAIPGVGKKTAERLVLELEGKLQNLGVPRPIKPAVGAPAVHPPSRQAEVVLDALTRMGYRPAEAERAIAALSDRVEAQPLEQSVREALAFLAK